MCNRVMFLESFHHREVLSVDHFLENCGHVIARQNLLGPQALDRKPQNDMPLIMTQSGSPVVDLRS